MQHTDVSVEGEAIPLATGSCHQVNMNTGTRSKLYSRAAVLALHGNPEGRV